MDEQMSYGNTFILMCNSGKGNLKCKLRPNSIGKEGKDGRGGQGSREREGGKGRERKPQTSCPAEDSENSNLQIL